MLHQNNTAAYRANHTVVYDRPTTKVPGPSRVGRLAARVRRHSLDRRLIAGADPASSPQLAARAARLASRRERTLLAEGVERLLTAAQEPRRRWRVVSRRQPLLANAPELAALAGLLRSSTPLCAPGIAIVHDLLTDGNGPAYLGSAESVERRLRDARTAMCG